MTQTAPKHRISDKLKKKFIPTLIGKFLNVSTLLFPKWTAKMALAIFRKPRNGRHLHYQSKFLANAKSHFLSCDGEKIATYQWEGSGDTILLMHGWESNAWRWRKLIKALLPYNYNIIAMEAPAHGASGSPVFDGILYAKFASVVADHYKPKVVIGHSVGGYSALLLGHKYKIDSVKKIVGMAPTESMGDVTNTYFNILGLNQRTRSAYKTYFEELYGSKLEKFNSHNYVKDSKIQGLVIHDEFDDINPYSGSVLIANHWPNSKLLKTQYLGHSLQDENLFAEIINFIKE